MSKMSILKRFLAVIMLAASIWLAMNFWGTQQFLFQLVYDEPMAVIFHEHNGTITDLSLWDLRKELDGTINRAWSEAAVTAGKSMFIVIQGVLAAVLLWRKSPTANPTKEENIAAPQTTT